MCSIALTSGEKRTLFGVQASYFDLLGGESFVGRALAFTSKALEVDGVLYQCFDGTMKRVEQAVFPKGASLACPVMLSGQGQPEAGETVLVEDLGKADRIYSDVLVSAKEHHTEIGAGSSHCDRQETWMQSCLIDASGCSHLWGLVRSGRGFTEGERAAVHHLFPRFIKASRCTTLIRERLQEAQVEMPLTKREREILHWVAAGKTNAQIGEQLGISRRTVDKHCSNLFEKMGFENRHTAIRFMLDCKTYSPSSRF